MSAKPSLSKGNLIKQHPNFFSTFKSFSGAKQTTWKSNFYYKTMAYTDKLRTHNLKILFKMQHTQFSFAKAGRHYQPQKMHINTRTGGVTEIQQTGQGRNNPQNLNHSKFGCFACKSSKKLVLLTILRRVVFQFPGVSDGFVLSCSTQQKKKKKNLSSYLQNQFSFYQYPTTTFLHTMNMYSLRGQKSNSMQSLKGRKWIQMITCWPWSKDN